MKETHMRFELLRSHFYRGHADLQGLRSGRVMPERATTSLDSAHDHSLPQDDAPMPKGISAVVPVCAANLTTIFTPVCVSEGPH